MPPRIISTDEAAALINDGDMVVAGGNGGMAPEGIYAAVERRFLATGKPKGLTLYHVTGVGAVDDESVGLNHFAHVGLVKRVIGGNFGPMIRFMKTLITTDAIEAYNMPQGVLSQLCRAMAAGQPGVVTHVGLHTFMDPRQEGGRMNAAATESFVELVELAGREWLFYRVPSPNICFIRGTTADEDGYVSMEHEPTTREELSMAMAVHNAGGTVVCQVERLAPPRSLDPRLVRVPGFLVDYLVVEPEQWQTYGTRFDPTTCGEATSPPSAIPPHPLDARRVMTRRAAFEIRAGDVVNLGVGVSAEIPNVAAEEGIVEQFTPTVEAGVIGGVPGSVRMFGTATNPRAIIDQAYQFDFYDGGGLDVAFLSFAEVDAQGNVNVTRFGDRNDGAGGFINISQNAKRLVFSGTLTGGGLNVDVNNDTIEIRREGRIKKFVPVVRQMSYNGAVGRERGQSVLFITERAVFQHTQDGLIVTEIAPGVRLQEDVLDQIGFAVHVSPELAPMDPRLFREGPMGLAASFGA